ncbi:thioesterase [Lacticaseibacillus pabuli]|uniref:Thioesterase n=1 Tax=Lacticaseibacillus pabuli TaxID=3025672 RepID=A0ABY7WV63_9LACO|nr:acyl-ACP thioesterase domain-containing protein [Lacticaseibacillus sp. KACC 23028]WDF83348.1 thioesterase [Lacticaseibacillus sp. KACC 23028]
MRFEETIQMPFFFATEDGTISLANLVNVIQQVSEEQLDEQNDGNEILAKMNVGWIIVQSHMQITKMPRAEQTVHVWTEARSYNKLLCYRDYGIDDEDGNPLVRVTSSWAMLDLDKRKLIAVVEEAVQGVGATFDSKVKRLPRVHSPKRADASRQYQVRYFDIDPNHHVNNVHYFDWMLDVLGDEFLQTHVPVTVNIKYAREVERGSLVTSKLEKNVADDGSVQTVHAIDSAGEENALAEITWRNI